MNNRVQIWMSREDFLAALKFLEKADEADFDGPLEPLLLALEEAQRNNSNYSKE